MISCLPSPDLILILRFRQGRVHVLIDFDLGAIVALLPCNRTVNSQLNRKQDSVHLLEHTSPQPKTGGNPLLNIIIVVPHIEAATTKFKIATDGVVPPAISGAFGAIMKLHGCKAQRGSSETLPALLQEVVFVIQHHNLSAAIQLLLEPRDKLIDLAAEPVADKDHLPVRICGECALERDDGARRADAIPDRRHQEVPRERDERYVDDWQPERADGRRGHVPDQVDDQVLPEEDPRLAQKRGRHRGDGRVGVLIIVVEFGGFYFRCIGPLQIAR